MKVKIISGFGEDQTQELVNEWFEENHNKVKIKSVNNNISKNGAMIFYIYYEEKWNSPHTVLHYLNLT